MDSIKGIGLIYGVISDINRGLPMRKLNLGFGEEYYVESVSSYGKAPYDG